ncbi:MULTISPECIES: hypothetical protein [Streptomyces]|uniref:hypothetical protein n=1 Tax=Streptomyces TaxID=1883 RepID=UPI0029B9FCC6|nr:hypothetical protein [Streptomyces europaeiscabiei]MDX3716433.1 hypothetical protein [Streptomyces europaeiscabiei]WSG20034.1 hypothetical protein OHB30_02575 [Streptomyces europaeiscabiei]
MPPRFRYGAYGYEGVTRVVTSASSTSVTASGQTLVVARAIKVLLTKPGRCETPTDRNPQSPQTTLAGLTAEYATLLSRHAPRHQAMHDLQPRPEGLRR